MNQYTLILAQIRDGYYYPVSQSKFESEKIEPVSAIGSLMRCVGELKGKEEPKEEETK